MGFLKEIDGDLVDLTKEGKFDVVVHGCNCFCTQGKGLALSMKNNFFTNMYPLEHVDHKGDIDKLGRIEYTARFVKNNALASRANIIIHKKTEPHFYVVNAYTQYNYGKNYKDGTSIPLDYSALRLCMKKVNHIFKGKHIGLPRIGTGLARGDWFTIINIIRTDLKDCNVTIVNYLE